MTSQTGTAYRAAPGFAAELAQEIGPAEELLPGLWWHPGRPRPAAWAAQCWFEARRVEFASIGEAAAKLRELAPWWGLLPGAEVRRSRLILDKLLHPKDTPVSLPPQRRLRPLGAFTLLDRTTALAAPATDRPFPGGEAVLVEDRTAPPSRAYRKLQEALLLLGDWPRAGDTALDCGAAPGAWSWVLASLGARVRAVDKAPLEARIAALDGVSETPGSIFALDPVTDAADWFCCDVICYPERLAGLLEGWLAHGPCRRFVVTVKFQGPTDLAILNRFRGLGGRLVHLWHNKHELTWLHHPQLTTDGPWPWCPPEAVAPAG